jgi:hypothetical protein
MNNKGILSLIKLNKLHPPEKINFRFRIFFIEVVFDYRSSNNFWGRFGGGWNWELGFQLGGCTLLINLLIFSLKFSYIKNKIKNKAGKK